MDGGRVSCIGFPRRVVARYRLTEQDWLVTPGATTLATVVDNIVIRIPPERAFRSVLRLVVGGIGSRCSLSFERLDELKLAVDAILDHRALAGDEIELEAAIADDELTLVLGPFVGVLDDVAGRRVTSALVGHMRAIERDGCEWIELSLPTPTRAEAGA